MKKYTITCNSGILFIEADSTSEAAKQFVMSDDFDNSAEFTVEAPDDVGNGQRFKASEFRSDISAGKFELAKKIKNTKGPNPTEQLLADLLRGQQTQIDELKKLNFKLMMFWIFLVVLPLLGWLLTQ
jgi:hypothetical protein